MQQFISTLSAEAFLFDMDHTLINNDCDVSWKTFLVNHQLAPSNSQEVADYFYQQYRRGELVVSEFMAFQLAEFAGRTEAEMDQLAVAHFEEIVKSLVYQEALELVKMIKATGKPVVLLTATNEILARPVANYFGIDEVLACRPRLQGGVFQAQLETPYSCGTGKVDYAKTWGEQNGFSLTQMAYFGDSNSDIPILEAVGFPVATNPVPHLASYAQEKGWRTLVFKQ